MKTICSYCKQEFPDTPDNYQGMTLECSVCGKEFVCEKAKFCSACGAVSPAKALKCAQCGTFFLEAPQPRKSPLSQHRPQVPSSFQPAGRQPAGRQNESCDENPDPAAQSSVSATASRSRDEKISISVKVQHRYTTGIVSYNFANEYKLYADGECIATKHDKYEPVFFDVSVRQGAVLRAEILVKNGFGAIQESYSGPDGLMDKKKADRIFSRGLCNQVFVRLPEFCFF